MCDPVTSLNSLRLDQISNLDKLHSYPKPSRGHPWKGHSLLTEGKGNLKPEVVPETELRSVNGKVWYIPHHGVYHHKKKDKVRIVFDCSAKFRGESLNDHLLQGPDLTNTLVGVLNRFRKEPVAFICDVEQMFHQFRVNVEDRNYLRFMWRKDEDFSKEPVEFRMCAHLFWRREFLKVFYHIWAWQPSWSGDQNILHKFWLTYHKESSHEI